MDNIIVKSGIITNNEEWKGNIIVTDDIIIPQNVSVVVHPNTRIKFKKKSQNKLFNKNYKINYLIKKFNLPKEQYIDKISIIVYGKFIVNGKKDEKVDIGNDGWDGTITVSPKAVLSMRYARVRYGFGIFCDTNSKTTFIDECIIEQCCLGIVAFSKILIRKSRINYNEIGIVCFKRFIIYENIIVDNFYSGTKIISQKGIFSKNMTSLNNIGTDVYESGNIKLYYNHYEFNNVGILVDKSHSVFINGFLANNFVNIFVCNYSYDITIVCLVMLYIGIYVDNLSDVKIKNSCFINLNSMLYSSNRSKVTINNSKTEEVAVAIVSVDNSYTYIEQTNIKAISKCAISILNSDIIGKLSSFNSGQENFTNLSSKIFLKDSKLESKGLVCMSNGNSDMLFNNVHIKSERLFDIYNNSIVTLRNVLCDIKQKCFFLANRANLFISESRINSIQDNIFELMSNSSVQVKESEFISESGSFVKIFGNASFNIETTKIKVFDFFCEIESFGKLYVRKSSIKNKKGLLLFAKNSASVTVESSKIKSFFGIKVFNDVKFECWNSYIFVLRSFLESYANSKIILGNNCIRLFYSIIKSHDLSQIQMQLNNNIFAKKISIIVNDYSDIIFFNSKFVALDNIEIEYNKEISVLKNIFLKAKNIFVSNKQTKNFKLEESKIIGKFDLFLKINADVFIRNSLIKDCSFINRDTNGIIKITGSEIQGNIETKSGEVLEIDNSKISGVRIENNSQTMIRASEIKGESLDIKEDGEINIEDTIVRIDKYIQTEGNSRISIINSKVYSGESLRKNGNEIIDIENSEIESEKAGIVIERGEVEITDSKVKGKTGIEIKERGNIKHKGLEINSDKVGIDYAGERDIEIKGIKITSKETALKNEGKQIKITDSEIQGDIKTAFWADLNLSKSRICGKIKNAGNINIEKSDIVGEDVLFESEISVIDTNINSQVIDINGSGNVFIKNSKISMVDGLHKKGYFDLICNNSNICSDGTCLNIKQKSNNIFNEVCLNSKKNYSVIVDSTNVEFNNSSLISKQGLLCKNNTNCEIKNMKADILFSFCNISKTNFNVYNLDLSVIIPKECFFINGSSEMTLKNINLKFNYNPIYIQFVDNKAISYLSDDSKLSIDSLSFDIQVPNQMYFLRSYIRSNFELNNINISGLYNFLYIGDFASGYISNSNINTKNIIFSMYQNSNLNIENTNLTNADNFKFITEHNSDLSLKNIKIDSGKFVSMSKNSQLHMNNSFVKTNNQCCKMQGNTCFEDKHSKWQIESDNNENYAFYLLDNATMTMNSLNINVKELLAYSLNNSLLKFDHVDILSETNNNMFLLADRTKAEITDSNLNVYSIAQLKSYSNIIIERCSVYIKDFVINLIGNSKAIVRKALFKNISKNETAAFDVSHNSNINISDSSVDNFYIGIKYENDKNINIKNTKINSKNKILFTNDKRFLSFSNPIQKSLLYKLQQFVLSTNKFFPLNKIYDFIYVVSISVYKNFMNKKNIRSLYLRRGMLNNWIAGSSDIDYLVILKQTDINIEYHNIFNIKKRYRKMKRIFPFYGENLILNEKELNVYLKYGGIRSKLLKNSKLLKGQKQNLKTDIFIDLKYKTDIVKEILNSYILLSNNYFYNIDIISDICFSKAATDILKYIEYFYDMKDLDKSRIKYLEEHPNNITTKLCNVLKNNIKLDKDDRNYIYNCIFNKLEKLSIEFNKEIILNNITGKISVYRKDSISLFEELMSYKDYILSIILDDPGLAYIVLNNSINGNEILSIYRKAKENYCFYNTPILFFTENMYQMLLFSNFRNNPFEFCNQHNISDKHYNRRFYISKNYKYYYQDNEILKKMTISSLAEKSVQINEIDIIKKFDEIKGELYEIIVDLIQFYLYFKNDKIIKEFSSINIIEEYKKYNENFGKEILALFEDNCKLKDEEKKEKLIVFIKLLKSEMIKDYE